MLIFDSTIFGKCILLHARYIASNNLLVSYETIYGNTIFLSVTTNFVWLGLQLHKHFDPSAGRSL